MQMKKRYIELLWNREDCEGMQILGWKNKFFEKFFLNKICVLK